ncbi:MAG: NUDIX domain-containing protein [Lachnospira sp.]|nr:NUDIX domain-containing protein [Lachnospira sp.]
MVDNEIYTVTIDRPLGSAHPDYPTHVYPINYGYIDGIIAEDGEEQDAYVIGVDIPLKQYTGKRIAIIHRKDDAETKWVIAPENVPYNKQQIEELVYFQEQYYDSYVEILNDEMWDAYDELGNKLGIQVGRSMAKNLPDGVFHIVVEVYVAMADGRFLTTQRSKNKTNPLKWEVTGGSILAGETPEKGALRELREETGIEIPKDDLQNLFRYVNKEKHVIYYGFITRIKENTDIHLQYGETMDYQLLPYDEFKQFVKSDRFVPSGQKRYIMHEFIIDKKVKEILA